jgi:undecaprenyl diphosphate synthase
MQSTLHPTPPSGLHVGIIMDGNGRWAESIGRSRSRGHVAGARAARAVVEQASAFGIGVLTLYAFSADNWKRPAVEVRSLMRLLRVYLKSETERCRQNGVRIEVIGRRDRLPPTVVREMAAAEGRTSACDRCVSPSTIRGGMPSLPRPSRGRSPGASSSGISTTRFMRRRAPPSSTS